MIIQMTALTPRYIMVGQRRQIQKASYYVFHYMAFWKAQLGQERAVVVQGLEED